MKCIIYPNGIIKRVSDTVAVHTINNGEGAYCSKKQWKEAGRTNRDISGVKNSNKRAPKRKAVAGKQK